MLETLRTNHYHKEQIELLLKSKAGAAGSNILTPLFFFYILKDFAPINILIIITVMQIIIFILRIIIANKTLSILYTSDTRNINTFTKWYLFSVFLHAFLLGISGLLAVMYAEELQVFILISVLSAMTAGAMTTLSPIFHAVFLYIVTSFSILIVGLVFIGNSTTYFFVSGMILLYIFVTLSSSFRIYKSIFNNITQRENFKDLLDITMEAIVISDENHKIIDINQSGVVLFKAKDKAEAIGRSILEFVPDYALPTIQEAMQHEVHEPYELDLKKYNGEIFPTLISSRNLLLDGKKVRIGTILDLTQLKQKDRQLIQQSRLAQMGEMISMIAHQWRQPLNAISATTNNLTFKLMMDDINKEDFQSEVGLIAGYSQHLSKTIDDFRDFFKENKEKEVTTLEEIVDETLEIAKISIESKNITIKTHHECNKSIITYPNEIKQVVLNLIKNAEDILIEKNIANPIISIETTCTAEAYTLVVKDNAGGIPKEIKDKIFEPYFSTKKDKEGTGLGLYMSKTIIEEHCGGKLTISNDENGAVFKVQLDENIK